MLVIGDLHGDYYKLKRILEESEIAKIIDKEDELEIEIINEEIYIVFIGDYIDWRGEDIENPLNLEYKDIVKGTSKIVNLVSKLIDKRKNVFTLVGNHEEMMFKALKILDNIDIKDFNEILEKASKNPYSVMRELIQKGILEYFMIFYNWYSQGGMNTIRSFDNDIRNLLKSVSNDKLFKNLLLFVYFELEDGSRIVISHSFPDDIDCIDRIIQQRIQNDDVGLILWSRKIWGIDAFNGSRTEPLQENQIIDILDKNKIKHYIVGHTRINLEPKPFQYLNGRVINVDNHGVPHSQPLFVKNLNVKSYKSMEFKNL
ncbi:MAG: metallophosphoesterase [Candidatus Calescibacterium sp.]|nr:metallophosphoesterase [Candidatus Calescibacterium sp.]MDW8133300.1 metallophosphoesterase [Candidatus Calescibacterium sp.]